MAGFREWIGELFGERKRRFDSSSPDPATRPDGPRTFAEDHVDFALTLYEQMLRRPGYLFRYLQRGVVLHCSRSEVR
jgi:hypothetical protein